jgi:hypothetical protein
VTSKPRFKSIFDIGTVLNKVVFKNIGLKLIKQHPTIILFFKKTYKIIIVLNLSHTKYIF